MKKNAKNLLIFIIFCGVIHQTQPAFYMPFFNTIKQPAITLLKHGLFLTPFISSLVLSRVLQKTLIPTNFKTRMRVHCVLRNLDLVGLAGSLVTLNLLNTYFPEEDSGKDSSRPIGWTGPRCQKTSSYRF